MITAKEDSFEELRIGLQPHIEVLIWNSSLNELAKEKLMNQMINLKTNEEAIAMIDYLQEYQAIPGLERTPITQYEIVRATRERADRDDFSERKR